MLVPLVLLAGFVASQATGPLATLSEDDIREAIRYGSGQEPRLYPLSTLVERNPTPEGFVYTPFLRVALLAHVLSLRGEVLEPENVPPALLEPLVYIRMWAHEEAPGFSPDRPVPYQMEVIPRFATNLLGSPYSVKPVWIAEDPAGILPIEPPPMREGQQGILAAFSVDVLVAGRIVGLRQSWRDEHRGGMDRTSYGRFREADLRRWR